MRWCCGVRETGPTPPRTTVRTCARAVVRVARQSVGACGKRTRAPGCKSVAMRGQASSNREMTQRTATACARNARGARVSKDSDGDEDWG
eukprot:864382-Prymnesium_polylepis.1